jgi:hypothetical protein
MTPLWNVMMELYPAESVTQIDTFRCFLGDQGTIEDLSFPQSVSSVYYEVLAQNIEWLWHQNTELCTGKTRLSDRRFLIQIAWANLVSSSRNVS